MDAVEALARRGMSLLRAKRAIECVMGGKPAAIWAPTLEDAAKFERELLSCGVAAERRDPPDEIDVKRVRERLGLSQDEFAVRFGLDSASVRNWEQGRTRPDTAVRVLLRVIDRDPSAVERALGGS